MPDQVISVTLIPAPLARTVQTTTKPTAQNQRTQSIAPAKLQSNTKKQMATHLVLSPKKQNKASQATIRILQTINCANTQTPNQPLSIKCAAYHQKLARTHFIYGPAVMRDGAAIGAKYRLMDYAQLSHVFGKASRYDGPPTPLADPTKNKMGNSADQMRDRLAHWPPDPAFGD